MAWVLFREGRQIRDGRTFGQCLTWAWREVKHLAAKARAATMRLVRLSPSLIRSPIMRATSTSRRAGRADWSAAYLSAKLGV